MAIYEYRRGNGANGNDYRAIVALGPKDNPWAALRALVANEWPPGDRTRRYIIKHIELGGDPDHIEAAIQYGPDGKGANQWGGAWLTAELRLLPDNTANVYWGIPIRAGLDPAALRMFLADMRKSKTLWETGYPVLTPAYKIGE